ncbi:unnamed protein product [Acanthoscelides obtectus]|uniref:NADP-dependent oxidoreductase domain-containing protein n=1 Tax=Acanthoscelides obtectus TaxID=200917 RepID=A0A9P0PA87_ACAOB|nr:unnamed protein product [Acanthoscelides obtectus]CAK1669204.1 L-galactose dehydrogenase [Acanthoscelides obtectus]
MDLPETYVKGFHDENEVRKMKYSTLGSTELKVSQLSLGTAAFSYFYGDVDLKECRQVVHEAIKKGINYIDTGPWYGHGQAEEILGKCLEGIPRKAYYLATKVGRYEKDPSLMFDFSAEKSKRSIEDSLSRLGTDYVDVIQVHDIEFAPSLDLILNETLPAVQGIVNEGKAKYIGLTGYPVSTLWECIERSHVPINMLLSYCRLTMIDDTLTKFIPRLQGKNVGIVNAAAQSMGLLRNAEPPDWHPAGEEIKTVCSEARQYCKDKGVELGKLALYYSLQHKGTATVLVGMNNRQLLDFNLQVLHEGLSPNELAAYNHVLKIFEKLTVRHWENIEVENYRKFISSEAGGGGCSK